MKYNDIHITTKDNKENEIKPTIIKGLSLPKDSIPTTFTRIETSPPLVTTVSNDINWNDSVSTTNNRFDINKIVEVIASYCKDKNKDKGEVISKIILLLLSDDDNLSEHINEIKYNAMLELAEKE